MLRVGILFTFFAVCIVAAQEMQMNENIMKSIEEGDELMNERDAFMADPSVTPENKTLMEAEIEKLVNAEKSKLNLNNRVRPLGVFGLSSGWAPAPSSSSRGVEFRLRCCKVIVPPEVKQIRNTLSYGCTHYYSESYKTKCGFWGWRRCRRTRTCSKSAICTREEIKYKSVPRPCPDDLKTCCEGYFQLLQDEVCISIEKFRKIIELFR